MSRARPFTTTVSQRGVALVIVLWVLVLLMLMVGGLLWQSRSQVRLANTLSHGAQARALAEGAIFETIAAMVAIAPASEFDLGGAVFAPPGSGDAVRVKVENEAGKVDLNAVHPAVFERVLTALAVPALQQRQLSDALQDFRDADALTRVDGAEDGDYRRSGYAHDAKDAPFAAVEEFMQVYGVSPELFAALKPALTVHGRRATPDLIHAGPLVRDALASSGVEARATVASAYPSSVSLGVVSGDPVPARAPQVSPPVSTGSAGAGVLARAALGTYTVRAEAMVRQVTVGVEAIVNVSRRPGAPYAVLAWHERPQGLMSDLP